MDGGRRRQAAADIAAELRRMGAPQEKIDEAEQRGANQIIEVLAPNWDAVQVWQRCRPAVLAMGGTYGINALEMRLVASALRVPWTLDLIDRVRHMASVADGIRAKQAEK